MIRALSLIAFLLLSKANALELSFIKNNKREVVPSKAFEKSVWFFYKPDCPVCYAQVQNLKCIRPPYKVVVAGFSGERLKLWRESRRLKTNSLEPFKSYLIDDQTFKSLPLKKDLSPQLILFDKQKAIKHFIGLTKCQDILKEFSLTKRNS